MTETIDDEFLATSLRALAASSGAEALHALGWWESLAHLDDALTRSAVLSYFRAQGRRLADSTALGGLMATPYRMASDAIPDTAVVAIPRHSSRRGRVFVVVGDPAGHVLIVDDPDSGVRLVSSDEVTLHRIDVPGRLTLHELALERLPRPSLPHNAAATVRQRSVRLGRLALALEMLGAAERALAFAVEHARNREQFGRPIGVFQAVRHHLAWARASCEAVDAATSWAIDDQAAPDHLGTVVKALSGRNCRLACERSLQVLGAIGFTSEHEHHHFHSRVLALDGLLGTSAELTRELGTRFTNVHDDLYLARTALTTEGSAP